MNIPSRQLVMKYLIHVFFNDQLIIIMVYIFHTKKSRVNDIIYTDNVTFGKKLLRACVNCYTKTEFK
jgi:hypothetical protein